MSGLSIYYVVGAFIPQALGTLALVRQRWFPHRRQGIRLSWVGPVLMAAVYVDVTSHNLLAEKIGWLASLNAMMLVGIVLGTLFVKWLTDWYGIIPFLAIFSWIMPARYRERFERFADMYPAREKKWWQSPAKLFLITWLFLLVLVNIAIYVIQRSV